MRNLLILLVLLLKNLSPESHAELTQSRRRQAEAHHASRNNQAWCTQMEADFFSTIKKSTLDVERASHQLYDCLGTGPQSNTSQCLKLRKESIDQLKAYRSGIKKIYQEMATDWLNSDRDIPSKMKKTCLLPEAQNHSSAKIQWQDNIRLPVVQLHPAENCLTVTQSWYRQVDQLFLQRLNQPQLVKNLSRQNMNEIKSFHFSPLKRILSENSLYDSSLNDQQLRSELLSAYQKVDHGMNKLSRWVNSLEPYDYYKLYDFDQGFQAFLSQRSQQDQEKARECRDNSPMFKGCSGKLKRCFSQAQSWGRDLLPFLPVYESYLSSKIARSAEFAGIMSKQQASQRQAELIKNALYGLGGIAARIGLVGTHVAEKTVLRAGRTFARELDKSTQKTVTSIQRGWRSYRRAQPNAKLEHYLLSRGNSDFKKMGIRERRRLLKRARSCLSGAGLK